MVWNNQDSSEPSLFGFSGNRHSEMQKSSAKNFFEWFWAAIIDLLIALKYSILILLISYLQEFQPIKYYLSRISTFRNKKLKKCKIQFFILFCCFFFFYLFSPQNLWNFEDVSIKCPKQFLCYVEFICRRIYEKNSLKSPVFGSSNSLPCSLEESRELRALISWILR